MQSHHGFGGIANNSYGLEPTVCADGRLAGMDFSFKVTESEFSEAWRVERKASSRSSLKTAIFWISIMLGLLMLYRVMQPKPSHAGNANLNAAAQTSLPRSE